MKLDFLRILSPTLALPRTTIVKFLFVYVDVLFLYVPGSVRGEESLGDNIKVVIGSQWIWTILRPWRLSQVGKGDSSTKDFPTMMFKYTSSNNHIDKVV